jgi:hypothetical protein
MRVGISIITRSGQHLWENGLGQNIFFLARLLAGTPGIESVFLLNCGDQPQVAPQALAEQDVFPLISPRDATDLIDVVIEMGGVVDLEWSQRFRALGKKTVFLAAGQPYVSLIEPNVFGPGGFSAPPDRFDEVWLLPKDARFLPMMRTLHRCEAFVVPFCWSPVFLEESIARARADGLVFGFAPPKGQTGLRAAIFEPNISVVKTAPIAMLICDLAYRQSPDAIARLLPLNTAHMVEHTTFNYMANALDIVKAGKALFLAREEFAPFMAQHADLVVSHQWGNDQNYVYLDALHGGYPVVHNSAWLGDLGYYYPDFDIARGAAQALRAVREHVDGLEGYRARAKAFIASLAPEARANQEGYMRRLLHLTSGGRRTRP